MTLRRWLAVCAVEMVIVLSFAAGPAAVPAAPTPLAPSDGASVTIPFVISWSAVSDPSGINGYNYQVSASPTFSPLLIQDSTGGAVTQDTISGLPSGTYYWRVQAATGSFELTAWSAARSVVVTGVGAGTPGTPTMHPTAGYSTFHPREAIGFTWTAVADAAEYFMQVSNDPDFPFHGSSPDVITFGSDNIPTNRSGFVHGLPEGTWYVRVWAVSADDINGLPSNVISYTVFYSNPVPPPPVLVSPLNNPTLTLPLTLRWQHVAHPQPGGYEVQVSSNSSFTNNEAPFGVQLTNPEFLIKTLTSGTKFWRVRSHHGMSSPETTAPTAWSATGTFTLSTAPPTPVSILPLRIPLHSGDDTAVEVQLTAGVPSGGATVALRSSHPSVAPVPSTLAFAGTDALNSFTMQTGQVSSPTAVTLTATLNGISTSNQFTLRPPALKSLGGFTVDVSGGDSVGMILSLHGQAPAGGAIVTLESNSPVVSPQPTVTIPAGVCCTHVSMTTTEVATHTQVTVTASWNGSTVESSPINVRPSPAPTAVTLSQATVVGGSGATVDGVVIIGSTSPYDQSLSLTSDNPAVVGFLPSRVFISAISERGFFSFTPRAVSTTTVVTISASGSGVTRSVQLTVNPPGTPPPPTLSAVSVSPPTVAGGSSSTGTVTLSSAAPSGGATVSLSDNSSAASVPASVTVPAGATSRTFTITTSSVTTSTTATVSAVYGSVTRTAALTINPTSLSAPSLVAPANDATTAQPVTLDWNNVTNAASYEVQVDNSSTIAAPFVANPTVTASQVTLSGLPAQRLWWRVRARNAAGVFGPFSSTRRFTPQATTSTPALSAVSVSPASVVGGNGSTGTVTLTAAAPTGGEVVSLSSGNTAVATVPASVTIPAGATSATFAAATSTVAANASVTITATSGAVSRTTTLTVTPSAPSQAATLTVTATGRSGERVTSSPAGINVAVGSTGSASFATGTSITLTISNGRDAIWSGACSSGGNKTRSCTFTFSGNASVTGNVQ
jgi:hypothetical protein